MDGEKRRPSKGTPPKPSTPTQKSTPTADISTSRRSSTPSEEVSASRRSSIPGEGSDSRRSSIPGGEGSDSRRSSIPGGEGSDSRRSSIPGGEGSDSRRSSIPGGEGSDSRRSSIPGGEGSDSRRSSIPGGEGSDSRRSSIPGGEGSGSRRSSIPGGEGSDSRRSSIPGGEGSDSRRSSIPGGEGSDSRRSSIPGGEGSDSRRSSIPGGEGSGSRRSSIPGGEGSGSRRSSIPGGEGSDSRRSSIPGGEGSDSRRSSIPGGEGSDSRRSSIPGGEGSGSRKSTIPGGEGSGSRKSTTPSGQGSDSRRSSIPGGEGSGSRKSTTPSGQGSASRKSSTPSGVPSRSRTYSTSSGEPSSSGRILSFSEELPTKTVEESKTASISDPTIPEDYEEYNYFEFGDGQFTFPPADLITYGSDETPSKSFKDNCKLVGWYSEDESRDFRHSDYSLRVLKPDFSISIPYIIPDSSMGHQLPAQVNEFSWGLALYKPYKGTPRSTLVNFLHYISINRQHVRNSVSGAISTWPTRGPKPPFLPFNFVVAKSVLTRLFHVPYTRASRAKFYAVWEQGTIYILGTELGHPQKPKVPAYATFFRDYISSFRRNYSNDNAPYDAECGTDGNPVYRGVFRAKINEHKILYTAPIDATLKCPEENLDDESESELNNYCLIKCYQKPPNSGAETQRLLQSFFWGLDCLFTGVPNVIAGMRTSGGEVISVEGLHERQLRGRITKKYNFEKGFIFLDKLLEFVARTCKKEKNVIQVFEKKRGVWKFTTRHVGPVEEQDRVRVKYSKATHGQNIDISGNYDKLTKDIKVTPEFWKAILTDYEKSLKDS